MTKEEKIILDDYKEGEAISVISKKKNIPIARVYRAIYKCYNNVVRSGRRRGGYTYYCKDGNDIVVGHNNIRGKFEGKAVTLCKIESEKMTKYLRYLEVRNEYRLLLYPRIPQLN